MIFLFKKETSLKPATSALLSRLIFLLMNRLLPLFLLLLSFSSCEIFRQAALSRDIQAETYLAQGKTALRSGRYTEALDAFEMARQRQFNQSTTASIYLSGLSAYYLDYNEIAQIRFQTIIEDYPQSRYVEESRYHLALVHLRSRTLRVRLKGMKALLQLGGNANDRTIGKDAYAALQEYLFFRGEDEDVEAFYKEVGTKDKKMVMEGLVYRKIQNGVPEIGRRIYLEYLEEKGDSSRFLNTYFPETGSKPANNWFEPDIMRVAVFMPFFLNQPALAYLKEIPAKSRRSLDFYQGFRMAIEAHVGNAEKKIHLKIFDTRQDTNLVKSQLQQLDRLQPHVIIGEIYSPQTLQISAWAEAHKTIQVIPFSASSALVENKAFTFLAHPSAQTHGARLAEYAFEELGVRTVAVFTDNGIGAQQLMAGYCQTFLDLGGTVDTLAFSRDYGELGKDQIPDLVDRVNTEAVYIAVTGNEEAASLILNLLKREGKDDMVIMGSPHFYSRYNTLGREIKESMGLIFTSSFLPDLKSVDYQQFVVDYRNRFRLPPSEEALQGYDLGLFLVEKVDKYNPELPIPLNTYFRIAPEHHALHVDFHFDQQQSNQRVNIGQFAEDGINKLNP
jgi:ABC-type branched-subunit amino acid transport system substrate-binding protein/tetratricopeptide (TPR) repeat protein